MVVSFFSLNEPDTKLHPSLGARERAPAMITGRFYGSKYTTVCKCKEKIEGLVSRRVVSS